MMMNISSCDLRRVILVTDIVSCDIRGIILVKETLGELEREMSYLGAYFN